MSPRSVEQATPPRLRPLALAWPNGDFQKLQQELPDFDELVSATAKARILENDQRNLVP